jgi:tRNA G37 N-methylase TrmD
MEFHVITLFPEMFAALDAGLIRRAAAGIIVVQPA